MRVISKKKLREYYCENSQAEIPLSAWFSTMKLCEAKNLTELRETFNSVDSVYGYTIFNVGGNNYRLITAVHYNTQLCYVRSIWTHAEYDKKVNKIKLKNGDL